LSHGQSKIFILLKISSISAIVSWHKSTTYYFYYAILSGHSKTGLRIALTQLGAEKLNNICQGLNTKITLILISHNFSLFPALHSILKDLFVKMPFWFCSMGAVFTINDYENDQLFV